MYSTNFHHEAIHSINQSCDNDLKDNAYGGLSRINRYLAKAPLRTILIVLFVSQIVLAVGAIAWLSARGLHQATHDAAAPLLKKISRLTADHVSYHLDPPQLLNEVHLNAFELGQIDLSNDIRALRSQLWKSIQVFEQISFTVFANAYGDFIGTRRQLDGSLEVGIIDATTYSHLQYYKLDEQGNPTERVQNIKIPAGMTPPERPWYIAAVEAQAATWTEVYTTRSTGGLAITAAQPVYDSQGDLLGVFSTTLSLAQINRFLQSLHIGSSGQVFIIDHAGNLIASSTGEPLYRTVNHNGKAQKQLLAAGASDNPLTRTTMEYLSSQTNWNKPLETPQNFERWVDGEPEFIQATPLTEHAELGWRIIVVAPEADFMEQVHANIQLTIALCFGALLLAIGLSIVTARWIAQPILQLNQTAKSISQDHLQQSDYAPNFAIQRTREVGELADSFSRMIKRLQYSFNQLRALNTELAANESRLKQYFEALPVGISVIAPSGQVTYINQVGKNLLGISTIPATDSARLAETFQAYRAGTQIPYPSTQMVSVRTLNGESAHLDDMELHGSGRVIPLEVWGSPIFDDQGEIIYGITVFQDISRRKQAEAQLRHSALHDALTDLPNRLLLTTRLEQALYRVKRSEDYQFAVLFLDLDDFKLINDSLGHLAGDQLLITITRKLQQIIRPTDLIARLGGDEFVMLLENIEGIRTVIQIVERILTEFENVVTIADRQVFISTCIGIVMGHANYNETSDLLRDADIALYRAKTQGRARYEIFDAEMHAQTLQRMNLEHDLHRAIERQELMIYYQPIVALDTENLQLVGFEALLRWQHPIRGMIAPAEFIPIAEETGLIVALDRWVIQTACQQLSAWHRQFPEHSEVKVSINLTWLDLREPNLLDLINQSLAQAGLKPANLTLEITESGLIEDIETTTMLLNQFRAHGVQISIDDFGTGYSSLSYLHSLPTDYLKIDKSFVSRMHDGDDKHKIVETIVTLSRQLQLKTVAEGIETLQQLECLQELGCELGQGYGFAQPLAAEAVPNFLAKNTLKFLDPGS